MFFFPILNVSVFLILIFFRTLLLPLLADYATFSTIRQPTGISKYRQMSLLSAILNHMLKRPFGKSGHVGGSVWAVSLFQRTLYIKEAMLVQRVHFLDICHRNWQQFSTRAIFINNKTKNQNQPTMATHAIFDFVSCVLFDSFVPPLPFASCCGHTFSFAHLFYFLQFSLLSFLEISFHLSSFRLHPPLSTI